MGSAAHRQLSFAAGMTVAALLVCGIFHALGELRTTFQPEIQLQRIAIMFAGLMIPVLTTWWRFKWVGVNCMAVLLLVPLVFFVVSVTKIPVFLWSFFAYAALMLVLCRAEQKSDTQLSMILIDEEKVQDEINNLEIVFKAKGEGISTFFEKYSTYYNLRKLAEELALAQLGPILRRRLDRAMDFIPRGDYAGHARPRRRRNLPIIARRRMRPVGHWTAKQGDLFDFWCIKNRKRLIVMDVQEDFRFAFRENEKKENVRSLIVAPLFFEGRVSGTLAIHATRPNVFTHDDLRLLDAIATLASSAIANALLYEKTEQLAIKDSLTGLFVRRYFYERLKEEHRRALISQKTMSLIMCDLDHFKECNDRFGHQGGDLMLIQLAEILSENLKSALLARYGGEEFAILLPETSKAEALKVAEGIRSVVENAPFNIRREKVSMTISAGVANLPDDTLDLESLVHKADQALYKAKREGRNKVCAAAS